MNPITVDDVTLHHALEGEERLPVLVFVNSLGTDFRVWDPLAASLRGRFRMLRYDKRGHGLSDLTPGPYTIQRLAEDLAGLMDKLAIEQAIVCGLSVGGMIAQRLAHSRGDLVRALVLMDTGHKIGTPAMWRQRIETVEESGIEAIADGVLERWFCSAFREQRTEELALWRNMLVRTPRAGYLAVSQAIAATDYTKETADLRLPALCIGGDEDGSTPPELLRELAALIPGAVCEIITQAGHLPGVEQPKAVYQAMDKFLRENNLG
ncbi:MAG: 3-oxoadipate enol-lactonase [Geminicoccaceae bacterium]